MKTTCSQCNGTGSMTVYLYDRRCTTGTFKEPFQAPCTQLGCDKGTIDTEEYYNKIGFC